MAKKINEIVTASPGSGDFVVFYDVSNTTDGLGKFDAALITGATFNVAHLETAGVNQVTTTLHGSSEVIHAESGVTNVQCTAANITAEAQWYIVNHSGITLPISVDAVANWGGIFNNSERLSISTATIATLQTLQIAYIHVIISGGQKFINVQILDNVRRGEQARTATATLTTADSLVLTTNTGASAQVILTLPAAQEGRSYKFAVTAAQNLRIAAPSGNINVGGVNTAGTFLQSSTVGAFLKVSSINGSYMVTGTVGSWSDV